MIEIKILLVFKFGRSTLASDLLGSVGDTGGGGSNVGFYSRTAKMVKMSPTVNSHMSLGMSPKYQAKDLGPVTKRCMCAAAWLKEKTDDETDAFQR